MSDILTAIILVIGISSADIRDISQDFANQYADRGDGIELTIRTKIDDPQAHLIELVRPSDFYLFQFFVNYVTYPMHRSYQLRPRGYWRLNEGELPISGHEGKYVMLFVPESDTEHDNVYAVTEDGVSMVLGFAAGHEYSPITSGRYAYDELDLILEQYQKPQKIQSVPMFLKRSK